MSEIWTASSTNPRKKTWFAQAKDKVGKRFKVKQEYFKTTTRCKKRKHKKTTKSYEHLIKIVRKAEYREQSKFPVFKAGDTISTYTYESKEG